jgi:hypothetical protein
LQSNAGLPPDDEEDDEDAPPLDGPPVLPSDSVFPPHAAKSTIDAMTTPSERRSPFMDRGLRNMHATRRDAGISGRSRDPGGGHRDSGGTAWHAFRENLADRRRLRYREDAGDRSSRSLEAQMKSKTEVIAELRSMLGDVFAAKAAGEAYGRLARAHGYVDGYMRALLELGFVTKAELLEVVNAERERASGPAMRPLTDVASAAA